MEEILVSLLEIIFAYPGAFIRWLLFYRGKKTIKEVALDDLYLNSSIGAVFFTSVIGMAYLIFD